MTFLQKHKENRKLLAGYVAYLDECQDYPSRLKLAVEIGRLAQQNAAIDRMPLEETRQDINAYTIETNALFEKSQIQE